MQILLSIASGGAIGAVARYFLSKSIDSVSGSNFPYGILICNILGSMVLGYIYIYISKDSFLSENIKPFIEIGILGSFTTFSAFSLEAYLMIEKGNYSTAAIFIMLSVFLSITGLVLGINFYKMFG